MINQVIKFIWREKLKDYSVVRVKGWNVFLVDDKSGQRQTITFVA